MIQLTSLVRAVSTTATGSNSRPGKSCSLYITSLEELQRIVPKVFPAEAAGKGSNISNQTEVVKLGFWGEGNTFGEDRGSESLREEVNNQVGSGAMTGSVLKEGG